MFVIHVYIHIYIHAEHAYIHTYIHVYKIYTRSVISMNKCIYTSIYRLYPISRQIEERRRSNNEFSGSRWGVVGSRVAGASKVRCWGQASSRGLMHICAVAKIMVPVWGSLLKGGIDIDIDADS